MALCFILTQLVPFLLRATLLLRATFFSRVKATRLDWTRWFVKFRRLLFREYLTMVAPFHSLDYSISNIHFKLVPLPLKEYDDPLKIVYGFHVKIKVCARGPWFPILDEALPNESSSNPPSCWLISYNLPVKSELCSLFFTYPIYMESKAKAGRLSWATTRCYRCCWWWWWWWWWMMVVVDFV